MALRIRFQYPTDSGLSFSIERLTDGLMYDFADSTFRAEPKQSTAPLPEDVGIFKGRYKATIDSPPAQFPDGDYAITVHHQSDADTHHASVVAQLSATVFDGDDQPAPLAAVAAAIVAPLSSLILQALAKTLAAAADPKTPTTH